MPNQKRIPDEILAAENSRLANNRLININILPSGDTACPTCGAYWGHPDKSLDFPNRQKGDSWKCYNPDCPTTYYDHHAKPVNKFTVISTRVE